MDALEQILFMYSLSSHRRRVRRRVDSSLARILAKPFERTCNGCSSGSEIREDDIHILLDRLYILLGWACQNGAVHMETPNLDYLPTHSMSLQEG